MYKARKHLGRFIIRIYLKKNKECIEFIYLFGDFLSICCACNNSCNYLCFFTCFLRSCLFCTYVNKEICIYLEQRNTQFPLS